MALWLELALLLACVVVGSRIGGIGLGITSGIGLFVFVFVLGLPPGSPPATVLGMILAVISALSLLCGLAHHWSIIGTQRCDMVPERFSEFLFAAENLPNLGIRKGSWSR